jgi:hypothetical protein
MLLRIIRSRFTLFVLVALALVASLYAYRQPLLERIIQLAVGHRLSTSNAALSFWSIQKEASLACWC